MSSDPVEEQHVPPGHDIGAISIERVSASDVDALLLLYADLFHDREPLTRCLGLSRERMIAIGRALHADPGSGTLARGLCWVARARAAADRPVGFIVCDDPGAESTPEIPGGFTEVERKTVASVMALLTKVRAPAQERLASGAGVCLHVAAIGVAPGFEGAGIATRLLETALSEAAARGFRHAFAECTGAASRRCHEKAGFEGIGSVSGDAFEAGGERPFAGRGLRIHLLWKTLDPEAAT